MKLTPVQDQTSILSAEALSARRGRRLIYDGLDTSFGPGITAILGPNGAGKTTLFESLLEPTNLHAGSVALNGETINTPSQLRQYYSRIGYMPQNWQYFPGFTVREMIEYGAWLKGVPSKSLNHLAEQAIEWVDLTSSADTRIRKLSGGSRQRVGLAEAFVHNPDVVLLDEPTVGLDPAQRALFRKFLKSRSENRAIVLSTHLTDDVVAIADRVCVVNHGRILFNGTPTELSEKSTDSSSAVSAVESGYLTVISASDEGHQH
ncbi:ATP-binding cassette domain-containing protein [Glutamicibacter protophormiae]|uniref:ABC transporter ATP-binding protein n=1 Tax=Glutamicibacter protophormiae TaxID=37930 RepID=UPI002A8165C8|nr:ATP-binding cassette domain-containing protein [Glutamicibacter protophormiae]WPR64596.1 ATP-binding cassette domain-containing protein [Glutamicibacter protophormiae]WPR68090.1 ATP-binding cassette domain-containing protein [Glutamicibacter protophormiae]